VTTWEYILWIGLVLLGVAGSAWCSGFETGMYSVNRIRLNIRVSKAERSAIVLKRETENPSRALATLLIANTLFGNFSAVGISSLLETTQLSDLSLIALNVVILTPVMLVFCEAVPKELFRVEADRLNYATTPLLILLRWLLTVTLILPLVEYIARLASRAFKESEGASLGTPRLAITALLKEGARHGILSEAQTSMFDRALRLRETHIRGEMIPWSSARTIDANQPRRLIAESLVRESYSHYPVIDQYGRPIGVVNHLDLCLNPDDHVKQLMAPPVFLDPDASVRDGLVQLRAAGAWLGVVMHAGKPVGVVTAADLIEPLIGSHTDSHAAET